MRQAHRLLGGTDLRGRRAQEGKEHGHEQREQGCPSAREAGQPLQALQLGLKPRSGGGWVRQEASQKDVPSPFTTGDGGTLRLAVTVALLLP